MANGAGVAKPPDDVHYTAPLYVKAEAARIIGTPAATFRNWAVGYTYKRVGAPPAVVEPLVTTADPVGAHGPSVPFIGLAEAYTLAAFRAAGVPMRRIRPAVRWLEEKIGFAQALASERLLTDGAEVLWDFGRRSDDADDRELADGLVVVRSGQQVFRPVVRDYLRRVSYADGWVRLIRVPSFGRADVVVDPWLNGGAPTLARRGVRVRDVRGRVAAGEDPRDVAADYGLRVAEVRALTPPVRQAA
jgi:uncharacterized protein (DUF433 family)